MKTNALLIIDDEQDFRESVATFFRDNGLVVLEAVDGREGIEIFNREKPDVVLTDLRMPVLDGFEVLAHISGQSPGTAIIVISGIGVVEEAIRAMRLGARDYVVKPIHHLEELELIIKRSFDECSLRQERDSLRDKLLNRELNHPEAFSAIITRHPSMMAIFQYMEVVAPSTQPILITGQTGVGKELFARAVHKSSERTGPFVAVNVAGLDDIMFSDVLFGHTKGSYTDATHHRPGLISQASRGTLFLDEIGDLKEASQVKLLRLLQENEYYPIGSDVIQKTDTRIVAATNRNLHEMVTSGHFRQDLYYRLNMHHIVIPALSERTSDISLLLEHFLVEAAAEYNKKKPTPPPELASYLATYPFTGNIRELRAMIYDAVARHSSGILSLDCFLKAMGSKDSVTLTPANESDSVIILRNSSGEERTPSLKEAEAVLILQALKLAKGNQGIAATRLGVNRSALNKRLSKMKQ